MRVDGFRTNGKSKCTPHAVWDGSSKDKTTPWKRVVGPPRRAQSMWPTRPQAISSANRIRGSLEREALTLQLNPRMATTMGEHDSIRVSFAVNDVELQEMKTVLGLIMRGYESKLEFRC